jgi:uncharacterized protein YciI
MYFVVLCTDKQNAGPVRAQNRDAHLSYLKAHQAHIKVAGPFVNEQGAMVGSMLIVKAEQRGDVEVILRDDPYARAGLFADVGIREWRWVVGEPQG